MAWMDPTLSLSLEAKLRFAQLALHRMPLEELLARAEFYACAAVTNAHLLEQAMRHIAELELQAASQVADARQPELVPSGLMQRPRWPWNRQG